MHRAADPECMCRPCVEVRRAAKHARGEHSGDCFQAAGFVMIDNAGRAGLWLVHAEIYGDPIGWHPHAWCEIDECDATAVADDGTEHAVRIAVVIDATQPDQQVWPKDAYYRTTTPRGVRRFTFADMVELAVRHGHDGPWPGTDTPPAAPDAS